MLVTVIIGTFSFCFWIAIFGGSVDLAVMFSMATAAFAGTCAPLIKITERWFDDEEN